MERKDWIRIGVAATVLLVPGGFALGAVLAARRLQQARAAAADLTDIPEQPTVTPAQAGATTLVE